MNQARPEAEGTCSQRKFNLMLDHFQTVDLHQNLDINGDGRVEPREIKKMLQLTIDPETPNARETYLDEVEKFKNMMYDCETEDNGEISYEEGIMCLQKYVSIANLNFPC